MRNLGMSRIGFLVTLEMTENGCGRLDANECFGYIMQGEVIPDKEP
jgi:hypothetical protein